MPKKKTPVLDIISGILAFAVLSTKYLLASLLAEQEENIYGAGEQAVHAGDTVFNCGAHVGVFTRVAIAA
jgi:hypothetical protein